MREKFGLPDELMLVSKNHTSNWPLQTSEEENHRTAGPVH